jgi:hypothetical protein
MKVTYKWEKQYSDGYGMRSIPTGQLFDLKSEADTCGEPYGTLPRKVKVIEDGGAVHRVKSEIDLKNALIIDGVCYDISKDPNV